MEMNKVMKHAEKELEHLDENQCNFTATEKHISLFVFLTSFWGFQTFCFVACVVLLLIYPPDKGVFSVISEWYLWYLAASWVIIFLIDKLIPKRTLACENGVITFSRKGKLIFTFHAKDVIEYGINYKEFTWVLKQTPKKEKTVSLMGFSWKEKKDFRNKLELLFIFCH